MYHQSTIIDRVLIYQLDGLASNGSKSLPTLMRQWKNEQILCLPLLALVPPSTRNVTKPTTRSTSLHRKKQTQPRVALRASKQSSSGSSRTLSPSDGLTTVCLPPFTVLAAAPHHRPERQTRKIQAQTPNVGQKENSAYRADDLRQRGGQSRCRR